MSDCLDRIAILATVLDELMATLCPYSTALAESTGNPQHHTSPATR